MDAHVGEIRAVAFDFAPKGWALCDGRLLSISDNKYLFSLLGTTFGGDGVTTFALPDYRGRIPMGMGSGPGLRDVLQGELGGQSSLTLSERHLPAHTHDASALIAVCSGAGNAISTSNTTKAGVLSSDGVTQLPAYAPISAATVQMAPNGYVDVKPAGGVDPIPVMNPYLGSNLIICMWGIASPLPGRTT